MTTLSKKEYYSGLFVCLGLFIFLAAYHINAPWRLLHEDTGATATAFATAHLKLGLRATKGHDFRVDNITGEVISYAHHPPFHNLLVAGVYAAAGSKEPYLARSLSIFFHLISLGLLVYYFKRRYSPFESLVAAFCLSLIPMSSFFGRSVSPDPLTLPAVIVFVLSYFQWLETKKKIWLAAMAGAALWGGAMDWPIFFALISCGLHSFFRYYSERSAPQKEAGPEGRSETAFFLKTALSIIFLGLFIFGLNLAHIWWAAGSEGLAKLGAGLSNAAMETRHPWRQVVGHILEYCRTYYTEILFLSAFLYLFSLLKKLRREPLEIRHQTALIFFAVGFLNLAAFPNRARNHHYWPFYLMPFMVIAYLESLRLLEKKYPVKIKNILLVSLLLMAGSSVYTFTKRHGRPSGYVLRVVEEQKRYF
ncbi:MAG: glycosyltransferase family 39 protein [Elusimicrobia bacterium]|nr:glycosyltransferase family 39 protein [Elusimicrobiota bacterium]